MFSRIPDASVSRVSFLPLKLQKITLISQKNCLKHSKAFSVFSRVQATLDSQYEQIPEHLKIHMFTPELEIIRYDELRGPFKDFRSEFILKHLENRANEVRLEMENSNPTSRLNNENVVRFMKVLSRLKQLFGLNGGNTEVLDAVIHSQSALNAFEAKLAAKKQAKQAKQSKQAKTFVPEPKIDIYAPGPYVQIPESLGIHEFTDELRVFKEYELKRDFGQVLAHELLASMENRLKQVSNENAEPTKEQGISNHNLMRFFNLFPKLQILLAWNGGTTAVLDTLLDSQRVFELVDARINAKSLGGKAPANSENESVAYKQVPEDMFLDEYYDELKEVKLKLHAPFAEVSRSQILQIVSELAELNASSEKGLNFLKLYQNLAMLFKYNHDQTFVLDSVLINRAVFEKLESRLTSSQPSFSLETEPMTEYRGTDHVISLLKNLNRSEDFQESVFKEKERTFQSALAQAMSKEEKYLCEKDPEEYEEIVNLTSDKIRDNYHRFPDAGGLRKVQKDDIEKYLKKSKAKKEIAEETKWRAQKAFEWSTSLYNNHRSFKTHNFFDSFLGKSPKTTKFPMFPGTGDENEYLILTSTGQQFPTQKNPLGMNHVPEDMFAIFQTLSEEDLSKFLKNVEKLRKRGWKLIGTGRTQGMLVLRREARTIGSRIRKAMKIAVASCGICFITLLSLNWMVDESVIPSLEQEHLDETLMQSEIGEERPQNISTVVQQPAKRFWHKLFWN